MADRPAPPRTLPTPDPVDPALAPLLDEPFASAWAAPAAPGAGPLRQRLLERLAASRQASAAMVTVRPARTPGTPVAEGVELRTLYAAPAGRALRPGEPLRACLVELQPGACWSGPEGTPQREWLVLRGRARLGDTPLAERDYRQLPAGSAPEALSSATGALLFLRESALPGSPAFTLHDAESDWPDYAPGIRRRVLWQHDGQAALLYHAEPGAAVPMHSHGHDEECLMLQGELFLDDLLLQAGDYQLAPAGTGHRITETDTGVVIYAHGDLDLKFSGSA